MRRAYYRGRRRRSRRGTFAVLLLLIAVFLVSCVASSGPLWFRNVFGVDAANYGTETVQSTHEEDGETARVLSDMVEALTGNGTHLTPFKSASGAVKAYRDALLNNMLRENYVLYTGNKQLSLGTTLIYPQTVISTLIPEADFEQAVYRYFGGTSVHHKDGEIFQYIGRVSAYTAPIQAWEPTAAVTVDALEETQNTYRMRFTLTDNDGNSASYSAIFVKRDDGSCYIYELQSK